MIAVATQATTTAPGTRSHFNWRDIEECYHLARIAFGISDRTESLFLTREALDLTARVLGD